MRGDWDGALRRAGARRQRRRRVHRACARPAPNLRRLERELALAWESGAAPVVVLTKADLSDDVEAAAAAVESVAPGADVLVTSAHDRTGHRRPAAAPEGRLTGALIGPSGAGKSTLANALLGEERLATREVRASDGRGRHQTVARELVPLPGGGVLLDTPGLRAVGMTDARDGLAAAFADIEELAAGCRFGDCTHTASRVRRARRRRARRAGGGAPRELAQAAARGARRGHEDRRTPARRGGPALEDHPQERAAVLPHNTATGDAADHQSAPDRRP